MAAPTVPLYTGDTPNRNQSPTVFANNADDWLAYQAPLPASYNALAAYLDQLVIDSEASFAQTLADAQAAEAAAANSAVLAQSAAEAAQTAANFQGAWSNLTGAYSAGISVEHDGAIWGLLNDLPDITASEPGVTADWILLTSSNESVIIGAGEKLTFAAVNELQASVSIVMPLANSVASDRFLDLYVAEKYKGIVVTIDASGSDVFDDGEATDQQIILEFPLGGYFRITSDGVSTLRV